MHTRNHKLHVISRGFTIIELLVCLVIITIITTIILPSRKQFEESLNLTNLAYDIALAIREAQVYSTNVRQANPAGGTFDVGYGVQVTTNTNTFKLFADMDHNHIYNSPTDLVIRNYTIGGGSKVLEFCIVSGVPDYCAAYQSGFPSLYISFKRPDSEACMTTGSVNALSTPNCLALMQISEGRITIQSSGGRTKVIKVFSNGQISVE